MGRNSEPLAVIWSMDGSNYECDCLEPSPPEFRIPPPPRPPFFSDLADCSEATLLDLNTCNRIAVIDSEYSSSSAVFSAAIIGCSILALAIILLILVALIWKHKRKMQNFLPCKSSPQNHCDVTHGNGVIYEDLTNIRPRPLPQPSMEMLNVKARGVEMSFHSPVFICPPPSINRSLPPHQYCSQDLYNPVYEELSNGSGDRGDSEAESEYGHQVAVSEDEFAEDELSLGGVERGSVHHHSGTSSLQGSTGNDLCRDVDSSDPDERFFGQRNSSLPPGSRVREPQGGKLRHRSLRRIRHKGEFHEGLLVDHFFRPEHSLPYILPVPPQSHYDSSLQYPPPSLTGRQPEFTTFRPSQDSDSGYSHNTSGGRGSSRGRKESHRLQHSANLVS